METLRYDHEKNAIIEILRQSANGASLETINNKAGFSINIRTLQRRLAKMHEQGEIRISGKKRSTIYHALIKNENNNLPCAEDHFSFISEKGKGILAAVSQPLENKKQVGYNAKWLKKHLPGEHNFLFAEQLSRLEKIGKAENTEYLQGSYQQNIIKAAMVDIAWNAARLEKNTYSLLEAHHLFSEREIPGSVPARDTQMLLNCKDALEYITRVGDSFRFEAEYICNIHALLADNLCSHPESSGKLRRGHIEVFASSYTVLQETWLLSDYLRKIFHQLRKIENSFEQAFFAMVHLSYLQPFDCYNESVARFVVNVILTSDGYLPFTFADVPADLLYSGLLGVYELNKVDLLRDIFTWGYERSTMRYRNQNNVFVEPNYYRLKYRDYIRRVIGSVILNRHTLKETGAKIKAASMEIPVKDRPGFIKAVDMELLSAHEGNCIRFGVSISDFRKWRNKKSIRPYFHTC